MPANLPPTYFEAEKRYREARTPAEGIAALEEMLAVMPKHKGTDKLKADLRRRISKLKSKQQAKKKSAKRDGGYKVEREGVGQVVLLGPPNVGKSFLVNALTNATPEVADFPHTTWKPTPGMMYFENIKIQLVDTPPISKDHVKPWLSEMIRRTDLVLIVVDVQRDPVDELEETVSFLKQSRIMPLIRLHFYHSKIGWTFLPVLVAANKNDGKEDEENFHIFQSLLDEEWPLIPVSAKSGYNLDELKRKLFAGLDIIRIYTKIPGKETDFKDPFILKKGSTVGDLASKIHKDFSEKMRYVRIWGQEVHDGQMAQRDHVLSDRDVVEFHL